MRRTIAKRRKLVNSKKSRFSRKDICLRHLENRFKLHHQIILTEEDVNYMLRQIRENTALLMRRGNRYNRTLWEVNLREHKFLVVYDKYVKTLVTVYPESARLMYHQYRQKYITP